MKIKQLNISILFIFVILKQNIFKLFVKTILWLKNLKVTYLTSTYDLCCTFIGGKVNTQRQQF